MGFNPSVGILWGLALGMGLFSISAKISFNPSVGILWGLAYRTPDDPVYFERFQSLGRDSVGFSPMITPVYLEGTLNVSIPRSGFCGV